MDIKELQNKVIEFRDKREWAQYHNPKDLAISISLEAAELLEIFQWKDAGEVKAGKLTNSFLKQIADKQILFPNGRSGKPSLSTLRRKLNRYWQGGFDALARKNRNDRKRPRNISAG